MGEDAISILGAIALFRIMAWLSPGPNMLAVLSASVSNGRLTGVLTGLGIAFGGVVWVCLAVAGVAVVFAAFPNVVVVLRLVGAAYLLWLGFKALRSAITGQGGPFSLAQKKMSNWTAFRTGFLVTATNPKAAFFYGSIMTAFVPADAPLSLLVAIVVMSGMIGVVSYTLTATVFSSKLVVRIFEAAQRSITAVFGILFCGFGLGIAYDAIRRP